MTVFTAINAIPKPETTDDPDVVADFSAMADQIDTRLLPRYASATARDAANPTPIAGQLAWLSDVDLLTQYKNGAWVLVPYGYSKKKTANELVNNSAATQADDHLFFSAFVGTYLVEIMISGVSGAATNIRHSADCVGGTATFSRRAVVGYGAGTAAVNDSLAALYASTTTTPTTNLVDGWSTNDRSMLIRYIVQVTSPGTVRFHWGQGTATATDTFLYFYSYLTYTKLS